MPRSGSTKAAAETATKGRTITASASRADSDTFLFSFQLLELLRRAGARFETVAVPTHPRERGVSREATLGRIARMFVEIGRARLA